MIVAFAWGYEGWGNHTDALIGIVDRIEAARGHAPPRFIDIRIRRQVRAIGFRDRAFEERLGPDRYRWLRGLGNRAIVEALDDEIVIADPAQAEVLVDEIVAAAKARRRVIFFCSCGSPLAAADCHRTEVARLALAVARRRELPLAIQEWPGGSPITTSLPVVAKRGAARLPVPPEIDLVRAAALPHFSLIATAASLLVSGPAICTARGWMFPIHAVSPRSDLARLRRELAKDVVERKLAPRGARLDLPRPWRDEAL